MACLAPQNRLILVAEGIELQVQPKTAVTAKGHRLGRGHFLAGCQQPLAGGQLIVKVHPPYLDAAKLLALGVIFCRLCIPPHRSNFGLLILDAGREIFEQPVFQPVSLALVVCFEDFELCHFHLQIRFLLNERIACAQGLDFGVAEDLFVHVLAGADRTFAGHNLTDETLFIFQCLEHIAVKCPLGDIVENMHRLIFVSLPDDTSVALGHVRGLPAHVQVVDCHQPILDVCPCPHF